MQDVFEQYRRTRYDTYSYEKIAKPDLEWNWLLLADLFVLRYRRYGFDKRNEDFAIEPGWGGDPRFSNFNDMDLRPFAETLRSMCGHLDAATLCLTIETVVKDWPAGARFMLASHLRGVDDERIMKACRGVDATDTFAFNEWLGRALTELGSL